MMLKFEMRSRLVLALLLSLSQLLISAQASAGDEAGQPPLTGKPLYSIWGNSGNDVFAAGSDGFLLHFNGSAWSNVASGTTSNLAGLWGSSPTDVFAIGSDGVIVHLSGSAWNSWSSMASGTTKNLSSVWGSSGSDVFAVGDGGSILHYDGKAWTAMNSRTKTFLSGVWGNSGTDVFTVGTNGTILHYNGSVWQIANSGTTNHLYGIWGSSGNNVFVVGISGTILHFNGSDWTAMSSGTTNHLYSVWGSSENDVFAVGIGGTVLHYNGSVWSVMSPGTENNLYGVWGVSGNDVFAVGNGGTIMHCNGSTWTAMVPGATNKPDRRREQQKSTSSAANLYIGVGVFILAEDGADFQISFRPDQSHWMFGYRYLRYTDTFEDPYTGRGLTKQTETKTGPLVCYLFNIEKSGSFYLGLSLLQWSRTEKSTVTGESDTASTTSLYFGGGYTHRWGSLVYSNIGMFLSPGTSLHTQTSVSSEDDSGAFDIQLQLGIAF
jgi:hypothetical protein